MAKADVLAWVTTLGTTQPDTAALERLYREVVLALDPTELLVRAELQAAADGTALYDLGLAAQRLLAALYDDRELGMATRASLEAQRGAWADRRGLPQLVVTEMEGDRRVRLWPEPDVASKDLAFITGLPFGEDFPAYAVCLIATEYRDDCPAWLDLPLAFGVLAREFARESRHRDPDAAAAYADLSALLLAMVR